MNKVFLDTNIILDLFTTARIASENSKKFVEKLVFDNKILVIDSLSLATISYIGAERLGLWEKTKNFISNILKNDDLWEIYYFNRANDIEIINFMNTHKNADYEDLHQYFSAKYSGCEFIVTNDKNFPQLDLPIRRTL